jgi:hypothetical protein
LYAANVVQLINCLYWLLRDNPAWSDVLKEIARCASRLSKMPCPDENPAPFLTALVMYQAPSSAQVDPLSPLTTLYPPTMPVMARSLFRNPERLRQYRSQLGGVQSMPLGGPPSSAGVAWPNPSPSAQVVAPVLAEPQAVPEAPHVRHPAVSVVEAPAPEKGTKHGWVELGWPGPRGHSS